ncbi:hypothetical protein ABBQ38_007293 [Trebouxia sp. C0009 RCD-2024]
MTSAPSQQELQSLAAACQRLWDLDVNGLQPGQDYALNPQRGKKSYMEQDVAPGPLFSQVNPAVFQYKPTYALFYALLDNYHAQVGQAEHLDSSQNQEVQQFLDAITQTTCLQYVHQILVAKVCQHVHEVSQAACIMFCYLLGFEHVFVGEARDGKIMGLHNWIQFSDQEQKRRLEYKGYIFPRVQSHGGQQEEVDANERMLTVQFSWNGQQKDISSMFIGTSPEFEVALYTLCFLAGQEENVVSLGDYQVKIKVYRIRSKYGDKVGSAFPELLHKVAGRAGANLHTPAPVHQIAPWYSQQEANIPSQQSYVQAVNGPAQQQPQGNYSAQTPGYQPQASQPAQQGCGNFLKSLVRALFGK